MRQVKFMDSDGAIYGGILLEDGSIICGCCGGVFPSDDIGKIEEGAEAEIVEAYDYWVNISDTIIG